MGNYCGYFRSLDTSIDTGGTLYCVYIISDTGSTQYTEIKLAGDRPFVVNYETSDTPFEPVRTSTATISIVHNTYLEDVLSAQAHGTQVKLKNEDTGNYEWVGFLTPRIYDQGYVDEYEIVELEAADCISSLQYFDYEQQSASGKTIVTIQSIINAICDKCELLGGYYWSRSKKIGNTVMLPSQLLISEFNFYSSDTDEPWKLSEVLEEICRYLGFTCLQWKDRMYFIDYQYYHSNDNTYATWFAKGSYAQGNAYHIGTGVTVDEQSYRQTGASISFEPVYNKCVVKDNFYVCEELIPNLFDDKNLINRSGDFYAHTYRQVENPSIPVYKWAKGYVYEYREDADDAQYHFYERIYDNKYWESQYYTVSDMEALYEEGMTPVTPSDEQKASTGITRNYAGGTIVDLGVVKRNYIDEQGQYIIPSKLDWTRYLCISQMGHFTELPDFMKPVIDFTHGILAMKLKSGYKVPALCKDPIVVINYTQIFEKYIERSYINPDWTTEIINEGGRGNGVMCFVFGIGDKYWDGRRWITKSGNIPPYFSITCKISDQNEPKVNEDQPVLNTVSFTRHINEEGYEIPLGNIDMSGEIDFRILFPSAQVAIPNTTLNAFVWLEDFSIKMTQTNQDKEREDSDVKYENIIEEGAVNELSEITCRITSESEYTKPSYSNVAYNNNGTIEMLSGVTEVNLSGIAQIPEKNIVEKYVSQYETPTKKIQLTLSHNISPMDKLFNVDVDNPNSGYVQLGTEIDYGNAKQTITTIEKK